MQKNFSVFKSLGLILFLLFLAPAVLAANRWYGSVYIDGSASSENTRIDFYKGDSLIKTAYTGNTNGGGANVYSQGFATESGLVRNDNITVKVWGINAATALFDASAESLDLSVSTLANTATCSYNNACSSGNCCSGTCAVTCIVSGGGGSTSTSGGGGTSGGTTSTAQLNGATTQIWSEVTAGSTAIMSISNSEAVFTTLNIDVVNSKDNVKLSVITGVTDSIVRSATGSSYSGTLYQYVEVAPTGITNADIKTVSIKFKVTKAWIASKGISKSKILLNRYTNKWESLPTQIVGEDSTYVYYVATSSGFSYFAIGFEGEVPSQTPSETATGTAPPAAPAAQPEGAQPEAGQESQSTEAAPSSETGVESAESGADSTTGPGSAGITSGGSKQLQQLAKWYLIVPILLILVALLYFLLKKKPKEPSVHESHSANESHKEHKEHKAHENVEHHNKKT